MAIAATRSLIIGYVNDKARFVAKRKSSRRCWVTSAVANLSRNWHLSVVWLG